MFASFLKKSQEFLTFSWPPNRAGHYILQLWFLPFFFFFLLFSLPILIGHRLNVYHTSTHDVALVQI